MRTKVAVSSVIDGGHKLVEVEVEEPVEFQIILCYKKENFGNCASHLWQNNTAVKAILNIQNTC